MRIPTDAIIPPSKLAEYLLSPRPADDKSNFLAQAGFSKSNPELLEQAIRQLAAEEEAVEDGANLYGTFYRVSGPIKGPSGRMLHVVLIWLQWNLDGSFHFVTLKPAKD